jgi:hypothetical protein
MRWYSELVKTPHLMAVMQWDARDLKHNRRAVLWIAFSQVGVVRTRPHAMTTYSITAP